MKILLCLGLCIGGIVGVSAVSAVGTQPAGVVRSATSSLAGNYAGTYQANDTGDGGKFRLKLAQSGEAWGAEAWFTFQGEEIAAKMTSIKVDGAKIEFVFEWNIQGTTGESRLTGESTGDKIQGTYLSTTPEGVSGGTWTVTRA